MASGASIPPSSTGGIDAPDAARPGKTAGIDARSDARIDAGARPRVDAAFDAAFDARARNPDGQRADAAFVLARLHEAGATLLSLPHTGHGTQLRQGGLEWVRDAATGYGAAPARLRPPVPSAAAIDRMDVALAWISLIPEDKRVLRRVVGARSLISPMTGRHVYSWRRIGAAVGADHKAMQRWHAQGVDLIVAALNAPRTSTR